MPLCLHLGLFCSCDGPLEVGHVEGPGSIGLPLERLLLGTQEVVGCREGAAQTMQQMAEIRVRLGLCGIRPEQKGQVCAGLGGSGMEDEVGQQGLKARPVNGSDGGATGDELKLAEQVNGQGWCRRTLAVSSSSQGRARYGLERHGVVRGTHESRGKVINRGKTEFWRLGERTEHHFLDGRRKFFYLLTKGGGRYREVLHGNLDGQTAKRWGACDPLIDYYSKGVLITGGTWLPLALCRRQCSGVTRLPGGEVANGRGGLWGTDDHARHTYH